MLSTGRGFKCSPLTVSIATMSTYWRLGVSRAHELRSFPRLGLVAVALEFGRDRLLAVRPELIPGAIAVGAHAGDSFGRRVRRLWLGSGRLRNDARDAGRWREDAGVPVLPADADARRIFVEHLLDHPCPTRLRGSFGLDDDPVSDVNAHLRLALPRFRAAVLSERLAPAVEWCTRSVVASRHPGDLDACAHPRCEVLAPKPRSESEASRLPAHVPATAFGWRARARESSGIRRTRPRRDWFAESTEHNEALRRGPRGVARVELRPSDCLRI